MGGGRGGQDPRTFENRGGQARAEFPIGTVGVTAAPPTLRFAPPTLCFSTPTFGRFGGFLALKQWLLTLAIQICHICRHWVFIFLFLYLSTLHSKTSSQRAILPHQLFLRNSTHGEGAPRNLATYFSRYLPTYLFT